MIRFLILLLSAAATWAANTGDALVYNGTSNTAQATNTLNVSGTNVLVRGTMVSDSVNVTNQITAATILATTSRATTRTDGNVTVTNSVRFPVVTLSYSAVTNLVMDCDAGSVFSGTLTGATFIGVPSNIPANIQTLYLFLAQDGTGGWPVTFAGNFKWTGQVAPTVTTNANAKTLITLVRSPFVSTNFAGALIPDFR